MRPSPRPAPAHAGASRRSRRSLPAALAAACLLACAGAAHAQAPTTVGGVIDKVFEPWAPYNPDNQTLISLADYNRRAADSREGINIGIGNALTSFPLGASSAGFTYQQNPTTGEQELKALSFGPVFVERALTNGKGVLNLGVAFQSMSFDKLQGVDLKNDGAPVGFANGIFAIDGSEVGDKWRDKIDLSSQLFLFSGSYGVTDRFDIGWAIPIVSVDIHGQHIHDFNGGLDWDRNLLIPVTVNGQTVLRRIQEVFPVKAGSTVEKDYKASATGVGDIVVRAKYAFGDPSKQAALVSTDIRLPTGDEENLLGTGKTQARFTAGGSKRLGDIAAINANGGYTIGGLTDEINFAVGTEVSVLPSKQLTMTFDVIGQNLRDTITSLEQLVTVKRTIQDLPNGYLPREVTVSYGFWDRGSATLLRAAVGGKYAVGRNWLVTGAVLFRLNENGFQPKVAPFIGLEHTFTR